MHHSEIDAQGCKVIKNAASLKLLFFYLLYIKHYTEHNIRFIYILGA